MCSSNKRKENETHRRSLMKEEGREERICNDVKRQAGIWMVFFLGAAAVSIYSPTFNMSLRPLFPLSCVPEAIDPFRRLQIEIVS